MIDVPGDHPEHTPYQGERGWHYRCDLWRMGWGPFPSKEEVEHMITAHRWSFPECRQKVNTDG